MAHGRRPALDERTGVVTVGETGPQHLAVGIGAIPEAGNIPAFRARKDGGEKDASSHSAS